MKLFSENPETILAECDKCKRTLKIPRTRCKPMGAGFIVQPAALCPCGNISDRIDRGSRAEQVKAAETARGKLSEKSRKILEEEPGFFHQVDRIWQLIRNNLPGPVLSFDQICDLTIGEKEGNFALVILKELGRLEKAGENMVRIIDNAPITDYRPRSFVAAEYLKTYGKMCTVHVRGGDVQAIQQVHRNITSEVFSKFASFLAPIEGKNYASVSGNPNTGEMIFSFLTKPISEQEFDHFDINVNNICAKYERNY